MENFAVGEGRFSKARRPQVVVGPPPGPPDRTEGEFSDFPGNLPTVLPGNPVLETLRPAGGGQPLAADHKASARAHRTKSHRPGQARLNCTRTRRTLTVTTAATFNSRKRTLPQGLSF